MVILIRVIFMDLNVKVSTNLIVCYETDSIYTVAKKMEQYEVGFLPVSDKEKHIIGVITDRDIVVRALANKEKNSSKIGDYMTKHIFSIEKTETMDDAISMMKKEKITRLLVTDNKKIVGIVSMFDLLAEKKESCVFEALKNIKRKETIIQMEPEIDEFYL